MFIPATFDLYEFDDCSRAGSSGPAERRWFSHWDGRIGAPAQAVNLAWSNAQASVLVRTSGSSPSDEADTRWTAAHVALGGTELPIPHRPESVTDTVAEMDRIRSAEELWSQTPGILPGGPAAETITWEGFTVGYVQLAKGAIYIAAVGVETHQLKVRKVQNWGPYNVDASTSFPLSDLRR